MFRRNVGGIDRVLRLTLGGILFFGGLLLLSSTIKLGVILAAIGMLALLTGIVGFCALYIPFDISTGRTGEHPLKQACDCAEWTKAMRNNRSAAPRSSAEEQVAESMTS